MAKLTKETLSKIKEKGVRRNKDYQKSVSDVQSGIKSLIIEKRFDDHRHSIFSDNEESRIVEEKGATLQAFNRYL